MSCTSDAGTPSVIGQTLKACDDNFASSLALALLGPVLFMFRIKPIGTHQKFTSAGPNNEAQLRDNTPRMKPVRGRLAFWRP